MNIGLSSGVACLVSQSPDRNVSKVSDILFSRYAASHRSLLSCDGANRAMYALTTYGEFKGVLHEIFFKFFQKIFSPTNFPLADSDVSVYNL